MIGGIPRGRDHPYGWRLHIYHPRTHPGGPLGAALRWNPDSGGQLNDHPSSRVTLHPQTTSGRGDAGTTHCISRGKLALVHAHSKERTGRIAARQMVKIMLGELVRGLEHAPSHAVVETTRFAPRVLPRCPLPRGTGPRDVAVLSRGDGVGQAASVRQLRAACDERLEDVLAVILDPAHKSVLQVRVAQVCGNLGGGGGVIFNISGRGVFSIIYPHYK